MSKLVVLLALFSVSCASLKAHDPFRNPDGTLNVTKILVFTQAGIDADCQLAGTNVVLNNICDIGKPAIQSAQAAADGNPTASALAAGKSLQATANALPSGKASMFLAYVGWAINKLLGAA